MQDEKSKFIPFIPADQNMREFTFKAIFTGIILSIILGAANAYLGLKAGMTVAATFPAAVIAMAVLRPFKGNILEENLARTTGAVGESLAAGAIFTIPAFVMSGVWDDFHYIKGTILMLVGGVLGVLFVTVLRKALVEDESLPYPESKACVEIVKAGQKGQSGAKYVFNAMWIAALIEFFKNEFGLQVIKDSVSGFFRFSASKITLLNSESKIIETVTSAGDKLKAQFAYSGGMLLQSPASSPAFVGVGYIIGFRLAAITFSGGVFGWLFLMPLALFMMGDQLAPFAATEGWATVAKAAYSSTIKPIAVGGMLVGAFYTLFNMRKNLAKGIGRGLKDIKSSNQQTETKIRTDRDAPFGLVLAAIGVLFVCMIILYQSFSHNWGSALLAAAVMIVTGFIFAAVAGFLVGVIGNSSNPISGLTLSTLLIAAILMVLVGMKGDPGVAAVLAVASVVCCIAGVAGDMIQDLKVGYMLGGTPWKMQVGEVIGVIAASFVLVIPIMLLHKAYGLGSEGLPAPQAGLMAMMSQGIVGGEMAWPLIIAGMMFAIALILIGSPSPMLIAVGIYLPFNTTFALFVGGFISFIVKKMAEKKIKDQSDSMKLENTGMLIASGLVAGEALMGIVLAAMVVAEIDLAAMLGLSESFEGFWWMGLAVFALLAWLLIKLPLNTLNEK